MSGSGTENVCFSQAQLEAVAKALGHTREGLKGSEIEHLLCVCNIADIEPGATKWIRLHNAFANDQNSRKNRTHILGFIRHAMKPARYVAEPERFETLRLNLNRALLFAGIALSASGTLELVSAAETVSDARKRAQDLRADLVTRGIHPDVLAFCREELLADNYFHAVLEASKSVLAKIRTKTGLGDDGNTLIDRALADDPPMLAINALNTESEKSEQRGFANLVRGTVGMFRNPTAHAPRLTWEMSKEDAEDLLSLVSLLHRRLDSTWIPPRV